MTFGNLRGTFSKVVEGNRGLGSEVEISDLILDLATSVTFAGSTSGDLGREVEVGSTSVEVESVPGWCRGRVLECDESVSTGLTPAENMAKGAKWSPYWSPNCPWRLALGCTPTVAQSSHCRHRQPPALA